MNENILNVENKVKESEVKPKNQKKPDESPGLLVESMIKIFDPESGITIVEGRA